MRYNRDWNKASFLEVFLHGIVMGSINKLPGISGGLYSLIIGFYNHLIQSIKSINYKNLTVLKKSGLKQFMKNINGYFLLFISFGMIMSYFSTSKILDYFLIQNELYVWSVFFGLIIGSVYILVKRLRTTDLKKLSYLFFGFLFGIFISFSEPLYENRNLLFVFFCGFISICGITIPGLSGSFLLILLGEYEMINILIVFFIGSVLGLIILSKFLTYITKKFPNQLDHLIIGFVLGTLYIVWPWNQIKNNMDQTEMTSSINSVAFILILIGLILTIIINNYVDKKNIRLNR